MNAPRRFRPFRALAGLLLFVAAACGESGTGEDGPGGAGGAGGADGGGATGGTAGADGGGSGGAGATGGAAGTSGASGSAGVAGAGGTVAGGAAGVSGTAGAAGAAAGGTGGAGACRPLTCQGRVYRCGNCTDDDGDGLVDLDDPDCLGPCHNAEDTYYGSIPGQAGPPCFVDCYFDQDSGSGNDGCLWSHSCDPLEPEGRSCRYDANANVPGTNRTCAQLAAAQSDQCSSYCGPLTPNGCDCFGCCELPSGGGRYVWLGATVNGVPSCDRDSVGDPTRCPPCTPVPGCLNACERCELCLGKDTLPADCATPPDGGAGSGGTAGTGAGGTSGTGAGGTSGTGAGGSGGFCLQPLCPDGVQPCGVSCTAPCPEGYFCNTGCCARLPR